MLYDLRRRRTRLASVRHDSHDRHIRGAGAAPELRKLRIILVDDNPHFLASLAQWLSTYPHLHIAASCLSAADAIQRLDGICPDLLLMDVAMPEMNGLDATRIIKAQPDAPRVILITLYADRRYGEAALTAGADGFVSKAELGERLVPLIDDLFGMSV